jgi:hypothetical protein
MKQKNINHNLDVAKSHIKQAIKALGGNNGAWTGAVEVRVLQHLDIAQQGATELQSEDWNK